MPKEVAINFGYALYQAQSGEFPSIALAMKGFTGANVIELKLPHKGNTYRAIYTVKFSKALIVLHALQKKSTKGIETPKREINLIKSRLNLAKELYESWQQEGK